MLSKLFGINELKITPIKKLSKEGIVGVEMLLYFMLKTAEG